MFPELNLCGYVAVIAIAVITIILELIYFKKKKLL